jgi:hypothetical protein
MFLDKTKSQNLCHNPFLGPRMKNNKIQKKLRKYYQKIITVKKGCQNAKK